MKYNTKVVALIATGDEPLRDVMDKIVKALADAGYDPYVITIDYLLHAQGLHVQDLPVTRLAWVENQVKQPITNMLGTRHRGHIWIDREGKRWRFCHDALCNVWERESSNGWSTTEHSLPMSDYAPFTQEREGTHP